MTTTNHLTPAELDALLEAARAATGDEWRAVSYIGRQARHVVTGRFTEQSTIASIENPNGLVAYADVPNNATFIAAANPTTIERLVLMVRELEAKLKAKQRIEGEQ